MTYCIRQMDVRPLRENAANHVTVTVLDQCPLNVTPRGSAHVRANTKVNNARIETAWSAVGMLGREHVGVDTRTLVIEHGQS